MVPKPQSLFRSLYQNDPSQSLTQRPDHKKGHVHFWWLFTSFALVTGFGLKSIWLSPTSQYKIHKKSSPSIFFKTTPFNLELDVRTTTLDVSTRMTLQLRLIWQRNRTGVLTELQTWTRTTEGPRSQSQMPPRIMHQQSQQSFSANEFKNAPRIPRSS